MAASDVSGEVAYLAHSSAASGVTKSVLPNELRDAVLFMSSNGAGVGHLMRLMAMARRLSSFFRPVFFTLSQSVSMVRQQGFPVEYLMSPEYARMPPRAYNRLLEERLTTVLDRYRPRALVFDGTMPYWGLIEARQRHPGCVFVWSRRAMWRAGIGESTLRRGLHFDLVIEPGDFAAPADQGLTVAEQPMIRSVNPLRFLDDDEVLHRDEARDHLGLDPNRPAVLVQLGAGNINDAHSLAATAVRGLLAIPDAQVCVTKSVIANIHAELPDDVIAIQMYPLARCFRAFDFAIMASGYNSFQEAIACCLPTIFVPNLNTKLDDQLSRAQWAQAAGTGLCVADPTAAALNAAITRMSDREVRTRIARRCHEVGRPNGAGPAIHAVEHLVSQRHLADVSYLR